MSRDVSLVFDVNVGESTQVIKSQLQGIFDEINKQPQSIRVAIDGASFNDVMSKLQEIRQLMNDTDTFRNSGWALDDILGGIGRIRNQMSEMQQTSMQTRDTLNLFAQDSLGGVTTFSSGLSYLNEELIRMRVLLDEISRKDVTVFSSGGFSGSDSNALERTKESIIDLVGNSEIFKIHLENIHKMLSEISETISRISTQASSSNVVTEMSGLSTIFESIKNSAELISKVLTNMFASSDGEISKYEMHLNKVSELLDTLSHKDFSSSSYAYGGLSLEESSTLMTLGDNIQNILELFQELKQVLVEISGLVQQINLKDFNITNSFSIPKTNNTRKELGLVKQEVVEIYKVTEQMVNSLTNIAQTKQLKEVVSALNQNTGGISNVYDLVSALDTLGFTMADIQKRQRIDGLDNLRTKLVGVMTDVTNIIDIINKNGNIKILPPDMSGLEVARKELENFRNQAINYEATLKQAATAAVSNSNTNTVNLDVSNSKLIDSLSSQLSSVKVEIANTINEVNTQLNELFTLAGVTPDTTKVTTFTNQIKTDFETLKMQILSGITEIETEIKAITALYSSDNTALPVQNIKEYLSVLEAIQGKHAGMGEVATQFKDLSSALSSINTVSNPEGLGNISLGINSLIEGVNSLNSSLSILISTFNAFVNDTISVENLRERAEGFDVLKREAGDVYYALKRYQRVFDDGFSKVANDELQPGVTVLSTMNQSISEFIERVRELRSSSSIVLSDGVSRDYKDLQGINNILKEILNKYEELYSGKISGNIKNYQNIRDDALEIMRLYDSISTYYNNKVPDSLDRDYLIKREYQNGINGIAGKALPDSSDLTKLSNQVTEYIEKKKEASRLSIINQSDQTSAKLEGQSLKSIVEAIGLISNAIRDLKSTLTDTISPTLVNNMRAQFDSLKTDIVSGIKEIKSAISSLPKDIKITLGGKSAAELKAQTEEVKKEAEAEKGLGDAVAAEGQAEEGRKISLMQFLDLYTKLNKLQNAGTHIKDTNQYAEITKSLNDLLPVYNMFQDKTKDIDNILELTKELGINVADAFDRGTMAAKQFEAAIPTVADGVKIQEALRVLNSTNGVIGKFEAAGGNRENASFKHLSNLASNLEDRVNRASGTFVKLGNDAEGAGTKVSDILRQIAIETENVKAETEKVIAARKGFTIEDGRNLITKASPLINNNQRLSDEKSYITLGGNLKILSDAIAKSEEQSISLKDSFDLMGKNIDDVVHKIINSFGELRSVMAETGISGTTSITDFNEKIASMQGLLNKGDKLQGFYNTQQYANLSEQLQLFKNILDEVSRSGLTVDQVLKNYGTNGVDLMNNLKLVTSEYNVALKETESEIQRNTSQMKEEAIIARELANAEKEAAQEQKMLQDAYNKVSSSVASMTGLLKSAKNQNPKAVDFKAYEEVSNYVNLFKDALVLADKESISVIEAIDRLGVNLKVTSEDAFNKAQLSVYALKTALNETEREADSVSPKVIALSQAYNTLNSAQRLMTEHSEPKFKNTEEYKNLTYYIYSLEKAINDALATGKSLDEIFLKSKIDGTQFFENLKVSAAQFNNLIINTERDVTSLSRAYSKMSSLERVINSADSEAKKTSEYAAATQALNILSRAISIAEEKTISVTQAFDLLRVDGKTAMEDVELAVVKLQRVINHTDITSINDVLASVTKYDTLLKNNSNLNTSSIYASMTSDVRMLRQAMKDAEIGNRMLDEVMTTSGERVIDVLDRLELSALRFKDEINQTGVSGSISLTRLYKELAAMEGLRNSAKSKPGSVNTLEYQNLTNLINTTKIAIQTTESGVMSLEDSLRSLHTNGTKYLNDVALVSNKFKVVLAETERQAKSTERSQTKSAKSTTNIEKQRQQLLSKSYNLLTNMEKAQARWTAAQSGKSSGAYSSIVNSASALRGLIDQYKNGQIEITHFESKLKELQSVFRTNSEAIRQAGENTRSFTDRFGNVIQRFGAWFGVTRVVMRVISSIKEMINTSIELDDAFTQLQVVTQSSESTFKNFGDTVAAIAKRTAVSMSDIVSSATTYARLGYSLEEASKIAEYTAKLQNVGDIEVADAQDAITAILKAYDEIDADHIEEVMNKLVVTGNGFPISVSQIAEGMNNASSALAAAGNTFEQSVALLTAANTTIQDAAKSSTALRTIAARLRKTDTELDELGESMTSSKYDDLVKSLAKLDVALVDSNNEYRATYDIMADIASKWESLTTMEQAALADAIAGTRQQAAFFSIIEQFQEASGAMEAMAGSAGVLDNAYSTYLDSTTAHINQFKASFQDLGANIFDSKFLSNIVDLGTAFTELTTVLVKTKTLMFAIPIGVLIPKFVKWGISIRENDAVLRKLIVSIAAKGKLDEEDAIAVGALDTSEKKLIQTELRRLAWTGKLSETEYARIYNQMLLIESNEALKNSNFSLAASFKSVIAAIPMWGWVAIAITGVIAVMGSLIKKSQEAQKEFQESTETFKEQTRTLNDYKDSINAILDSEDTEAEKLQALGKIKDELNEKYDLQIQNIKDEAEARKVLTQAIADENKEKRDTYLNDNEDAYKAAVERTTNFSSEFSWNDWRWIKSKQNYGSFRIGSRNNFSQEIQNLFESDKVVTKNGLSFAFASDVKNELEYFDKLTEMYNKFGEIKRRKEANGNLTKDELALYKEVQKQYNMLSDELTGGDVNYKETILGYAKARAEELIEQFPQVDMTLKQWQDGLIRMAHNDQYIIDQIKELTYASINSANTIVDDAIDKINSALDTISGKLDVTRESISKADDYFEDLAKTIKSNDDMDKFFTSSEIIELLEKYPELNDAILQTEYGYKIETDALETLREAKLKEQKEAIYLQMQETQGLMNSVEKDLELYQAKIGGIESVETAQLRLAEVENELANIKPFDNSVMQGPSYADKYTKERANLKGYIDARERLSKLKEDFDKSRMQYTVLGEVFDDLKNKTEDSTKAINNQKSALKDLQDEYKKAKDDIENLIKLTMDMIKKNKELEKDALKEQLDNFKKLIEKRKQLISLEKDQYNFEKDLKEQNRDLLEIQQELDSLSVAGAEYSLEDLKRKEELQKQYIEQSEKRDDFLYDHEVETRTKALEDEEEIFEDNINTQIKAIEDYLKHEGKIRQDAVDLINSKTQAFYNDLLDYTMNFTDKSRFEFDKLWADAYAALEKYSNGQINVDLALAFLIGKIQETENEIKALEEKLNSAKETATKFTDGVKSGMEDVIEVTAEAVEEVENLKDALNDVKAPQVDATPVSKPKPRPLSLEDWLAENGGAKKRVYGPITLEEYLAQNTHHNGGIVGGSPLTKDSEVLAKLLAGEVVVTTAQASNFMKNTLPKLATANTVNNQMSPTITIGDINITGDADSSIISKLNQARQEIVDGVLKAVNNQTRIFNGGRVRTV